MLHSPSFKTDHFDPNWSVFSAPVNALLAAAEQSGQDRKQMCAEAGIALESLAVPDVRIPVSAYFQLYETVVAALGNPDIGLAAARVSFLAGLNLQLYMTTICHTFRDYLNLMPSILKLWGDIGEVRAKSAGDLIGLEWHPLYGPSSISRFLTDSVLGGSARIIDSLCLSPVPVRKACLTYDQPDNLAELQRCFGEKLEFNADTSCLYFDRAALDYPLVQQNYFTQPGIAIPFADLFDGKDPSDKFWSKLRQAIVRRLPTGDVGVKAVAYDLNVSPRTLQRKLTERQTSYGAELQKIRADLSARYLIDPHISITEAAFLVGYSDPSAYSSAFKKWHDISPKAYRARHQDGANGYNIGA
jgi:AraC-like DNA-binding protein